MYTIKFVEQTVHSTSKILECPIFSSCLFNSPNERHSYLLKYCSQPIRYIYAYALELL